MPKYASDTSVSVEKSRAEIEKLLVRFGASSFAYGWKDGSAIVEFVCGDRRVRFTMKLPSKFDKEFTTRLRYGREAKNTPEQAEELWEQACRSYWRALVLLIKAKLAAVEAGITEFEDEFLSHIVVPAAGGRTTTAGEWLKPQLADAYSGDGGLRKLPLLPSG